MHCHCQLTELMGLGIYLSGSAAHNFSRQGQLMPIGCELMWVLVPLFIRYTIGAMPNEYEGWCVVDYDEENSGFWSGSGFAYDCWEARSPLSEANETFSGRDLSIQLSVMQHSKCGQCFLPSWLPTRHNDQDMIILSLHQSRNRVLSVLRLCMSMPVAF